MARTISPEIEVQKCGIHGVELVKGVCPRCEYIQRRKNIAPDTSPENDTRPTQRGAEDTNGVQAVSEPTRRTKMPDDKEYVLASRCHWPCPCGGTVPDVPSGCKHKKYVARPQTYCTDVQVCHTCKDNITCNALLRFHKLVDKRKRIDMEKAAEKPKKED